MGLDLLRSQYRGGGQVLVDGRQKFDAAIGQELAGAPQFQIHGAERRAAVARHEPGAVEAIGPVAVALIEQDADQGLGSGQEHAPGPARVAVHQRIVVEGA
jgi:hypothetical protein